MCIYRAYLSIRCDLCFLLSFLQIYFAKYYIICLDQFQNVAINFDGESPSKGCVFFYKLYFAKTLMFFIVFKKFHQLEMTKYMFKTFIYSIDFSIYSQRHVQYSVNNVEHVCCYILVMSEKYINNFQQPRKHLDVIWNMNVFDTCRAVKHAFLWLYLLKKQCILERCNMRCLYLHSIYSILV